MCWKYLFILFAIFSLWSAPVSADDFAKSCQVILQSESTICGTSGTATYQAAFTNLVPKYLVWQKVWTDAQGGQQTETLPPEPANLDSQAYFFEENSDGFGYSNELLNSAQQTADGGYVAVGDTNSFGGPRGMNEIILKYDNLGKVSWAKVIGGNDHEYAQSIKQTSDGGYIMAGYDWVYGTMRAEMLLSKFNDQGDLSWTKKVTNASVSFYGRSVEQTSDGGYIVAGNAGGYNFGSIYPILIKFDGNGNLSWSKQFNSITSHLYDSVVQTSDGGYAIASSVYGGSSQDILLVKTDSSGNVSWSKTIQSPGNQYLYSLQQTENGGFIAVGSSHLYNQVNDYALILMFNSSGDIQWSRYFKIANGFPYAMSVGKSATSGEYLVAGYNSINYSGAQYRAFFIKINDSGSVLWAKATKDSYPYAANDVQEPTGYGGLFRKIFSVDISRAEVPTTGSGSYVPNYIQETQDGGFFASGNATLGGTSGDTVFLIKTDSNNEITGCDGLVDTNYDISSPSLTATDVNLLPATIASNQAVHSFLDNSHSLLYVSTNTAGLSVIDTKGSATPSDDTSVVTYNRTSSPNIMGFPLHSFLDNSRNLLYISGWGGGNGNGLAVIDTKGTVTPSDDNLVATYGTTTSPAIAEDSTVHSFLDPGHNLLYITTMNRGVSVINTQGTTTPYDDTLVTTYSTTSSPAIGDNHTSMSFLDSSRNLLYIGTQYGGLSVIDTKGTIAAYDDTLVKTYNTASSPAITSNYVLNSFLDSARNLLYVGTQGGLSVIDTRGTVDPADDTLVTTYNSTSSPAIAGNQVLYSFLDPVRNLLYAGTIDSGLFVIDTKGTVTPSDDILATTYSTGSSPAIGGDRIAHAFLDESRNFLYIGTANGLSVIDTKGTVDSSDDTLVTTYKAAAAPPAMNVSSVSLQSVLVNPAVNYRCQYFYTPPSEITKSILYTGMSAYTLNLTAEEQDGTQTPCESFSTVTVTDKKTCEMVPEVITGDGTKTPITKDANDIYKVYAGQTVGVEPSLFCLKPGGSTGWTNQGGNLLSSTNTLMKLFFDTGGLVKAGGSYTDPDGNAAVCTDAGIQVRERLRVGF